MEDETSTEDSQEEEIENPLTKKTRNKEEETTPKKIEEEEIFHSALFKNKKIFDFYKLLIFYLFRLLLLSRKMKHRGDVKYKAA